MIKIMAIVIVTALITENDNCDIDDKNIYIKDSVYARKRMQNKIERCLNYDSILIQCTGGCLLPPLYKSQREDFG